MDWKDIPSLSALRAFEAAARMGSYSAAARALNVTHAAIAQHVRALEERFGQKLVERSGRGVAATASGAQLAEDLGRGFGEIAAGVRALDQARAEGPLSLTTTRTFAENWLMPRMAGFWAAHPEIPLAVSTEDGVLDLRTSGHHMAIRYCSEGKPDGVNARYFKQGRKVVIARSDVVAGIDGGADLVAQLARLPWLIDSTYAEYVAWFEQRVAKLETVNATFLVGNPLILSAVRAGAGLAIMPKAIVVDDIEAGRLQVMLDDDQDAAGYFIVTPDGPVPDRVKVFERWLQEQVADG